MKTYLVVALLFSLQFLQSCLAGKIRTSGIGNVALLAGTTALHAATGMPFGQPFMAPPPPMGMQPTLYQRKQAEATMSALKNEEQITDLSKTIRDLADTYKQIQQDIAGPLEAQTASLKQERDMIMKKLSVLTKTLRYKHDLLHPELSTHPIVIIARDHDDTMRAEANRIDATGALDALKGISSPCAGFHKSRNAEKQALQKPTSENNSLDVEAETLQKMSPEERINYDNEMVKQNRMAVKEIEDEIKAAEKEKKIMMRGGMMMPPPAA